LEFGVWSLEFGVETRVKGAIFFRTHNIFFVLAFLLEAQLVIDKPQTSNLKPQTSNLKPQTSNSKPQTPNPKRFT
jgi:hypothetical protein